MTFSTTPQRTILFLGATGGVGLSALRRALDAGHACTALCRTPSKLTTIFPAEEYPDLTVIEGNAHDENATRAALKSPLDSTRMVDCVLTSIGMGWKGMGFDDPTVCEDGMTALLGAAASLRREGVAGEPYIVAVSSTGISKFGRDIPMAYVPLYHTLGRTPHKDKAVMEDLLIASGERFTVVRPSLFVDSSTPVETPIRVGLEDPKTGVVFREIGYTISREDVGRWIFGELLSNGGENKYVGKIPSITY